MVIRIETHKCEVSPQFYHYCFAYGADMLCFVKKVKMKSNTRKALIEGRLSIDWSLWNDRYATDFLYLKVKIIV